MFVFRRLTLVSQMSLLMIVATLVCCRLKGEMYLWNARIRPPVSIGDALALATEELGEGRDSYYCTYAQLFGNKNGDPQPGGWSFDFSAEDGRETAVRVDLNRQVEVDHYLLSDVRLSGAINELSDAPDVFAEFLKVHQLDGKITDGTPIVMAVNTRAYEVYRTLESGAWSDDLTTITGPRADGFVVRVYEDKLARQPKVTYTKPPMYWHRSENLFSSGDGKRLLVVEVEYGAAVSHNTIKHIFGLFVVTEN